MSRRDPGGPQRPRELARWGREKADPGKPGGRQCSAASEAASVGGRRRTAGNGLESRGLFYNSCHSSAISGLSKPLQLAQSSINPKITVKDRRRRQIRNVQIPHTPDPQTQRPCFLSIVKCPGPSSPRARWYRKQLEKSNRCLPLSKPTSAYQAKTKVKPNLWPC